MHDQLELRKLGANMNLDENMPSITAPLLKSARVLHRTFMEKLSGVIKAKGCGAFMIYTNDLI